MKLKSKIEKFVSNFYFGKRSEIKTTSELDKKIINDALPVYEKSIKTQSASTQPNIWKIIMQNKMAKFSSAAVVLLVVLYMLVGNQSGTVWAFEQSIEAIKDYNAVYMEGTLPDGYFELWGRSDDSGEHSNEFVVRTSNGIIAWVKDGSTYIYLPEENKVYFENAITNGFSQWLGPELLELLASMKNTKVMYGKDSKTGRKRVTVRSSFLDVKGPQSFIIEFDAETKLAVSMRQWDNMDMSGQPGFNATKIVFYKEVDDSLFEVDIAGNPAYVEKPLTIPEENIGFLSNLRDGISTEELSEQEACEKILTTMYNALIAGDIDTIKKLSPVAANMDDKFLREFLIREGKDEQAAKLVSIGEILRRGETKLGPIVAVPVIYQRRDDVKIKDLIIVQFRNIASEPSCVIHGPYGFSQKIK